MTGSTISFPGRCLLFLGAICWLGASAQAEEQWETLPHCQLLPNAASDGDSFHVRAAGKEYIFRLYFVDSPETDASLPERVAAQAKYFGLTVPQALQVGLEAERYTRQRLGRPFTVITCRQDARGRSALPRYFAFVEMGNEDLAEELVSQGLARVYGAPGRAPGRTAPEVERRKLDQLERAARLQKLGGWGLREGRRDLRAAAAPIPSSTARPDSFDAFFHPQAAASPGKKGRGLDINQASIVDLQNLPGIGLVLARRIVAARPFRSADELRRVSGIGARRYELLRPYFR